MADAADAGRFGEGARHLAAGRVAAAVPGVPVRLAGDGVCMALGEPWRGAGRGARRVQSELSFHSLRHPATTLLKSTGASNAIAGEIIGHDSAAISRGYTHIETDTLRKAVDAMPDILAKPAAPPASPNSRR